MIFKIQLKISRLFICGDTELKAIDDFDLMNSRYDRMLSLIGSMRHYGTMNVHDTKN